MVAWGRTALAFIWSYEGSFWLLVALCLTLGVWVVPFQATGQPKETVEQIAWAWWPLVALYVLLGLSTLVCTYRRFARDYRRCVRPLSIPAQAPAACREAPALQLGDVENSLVALGYEVRREGQTLHGVRNKWSPLGGSLFHFALLVLVLAVVFQHRTAQTAEVRVTEGQSFNEAAAGEPAWARRLTDGLVLKKVVPQYFEDYLLFTKLEAAVSGADGKVFTTSLAGPRWLDPSTHMSIQDYGLAPTIRITDAQGKTVAEPTVALNVFPPGAEDSIDFTPYGLSITLVAYPDYGVIDGRDVSVTYNVRKPKYRVVVESTSDGTLLARSMVSAGEVVEAGTYDVSITGLSRYGTFKLYRSHAVPIALVAMLLMLVGLAARLLMPRHDVVVWSSGDGLLVDGMLDGYGREAGRERAVTVLNRRA